MPDDAPLLRMVNIVKNFPGVKALKGVDLDVVAGEVHALMGENGAGKSTLMKCLIGIHPQTSGDIYFQGRKLPPHYNPAEALDMGLAMIHQELSPIAHRPIMENIWLGREPKNKFGLIDHAKMAEMTRDVLKLIDLDIDPRTRMGELTVAKMQMVEIAKALSFDAKLIIMDEPTSAITDREVTQLFKLIERLKSEGRGIVYISHKMDEIFQIADRITVFRDGERVGTDRANDTTMDRMITMMVGRPIDEMFPKVDCDIGAVHLEVKGLSSGRAFKDVSFTVRKGEILGLAGLVGAGRSEVVESIFGLRHLDAGEIFIDGKPVSIRSPGDAIGHGMAFLTEDRRDTGIFPMLDIQFNMYIANMRKFTSKSSVRLLSFKRIKEEVTNFIDTINIKTPSQYQKIENLSGGNQQKVLVARWLMTEPEILFLDEPTRGIDVGAKAEIHKLVTYLAGQGKCVVMISSELPEVLGMSDRVVVMYEGKVTGILDNTNQKLTQEEVMRYASGAVELEAAGKLV
ncbi:MAG: sugar ABC transporter ATP-binding protein [Planctomycetaceae bacterium]|nr:sugar ABC transporter ATP-binding protein [Planctomycetaceae bacterium]